AENPPNRRGGAPGLAQHAARLEQAGVFSDLDPRRRKQRVTGAPGVDGPQLVQPVDKYLLEDLVDREEERRDGLAKFRPHFARILVNAAPLQVDVAQFQRCESPVTRKAA